VRDFVLGTRILNGRGEDLNFGGRVIKNVAGYDVSRLMAGALGTLGVLLDISFKVLPLPTAEATLRFDLGEAEAIRRVNQWSGQPLPLSASSWHDQVLLLRLSGAASGVRAAQAKLGGELLEENAARQFWNGLRDQRAGFFGSDEPLWRVSLPATTPPLDTGLPQWIEWGGALRWLRGHDDAATLRAKVGALGGHVTRFRHADSATGVFHPLPPKLADIHRKLKIAFDPAAILNRGRMDSF
jgi:glycolate oxidase FAD binding subunit